MQKEILPTPRFNLSASQTSPSSSRQPNPFGTLVGIGVGPGDPELISFKALKYLQSSPVVAFPAGRDQRPGVAETILAPWLRPEQTRVPLYFPYVRDPAQLELAWETAAKALCPYLQTGDVVFACEGDVSFYSTFTYLAQSLLSIYPQANVITIPGISSPMAAAAALNIPLTTQGQRLAVLPALYAANQLEDAIRWAEVIVLMKVSSVYNQIWQILKQHCLLSCSYVVENATRADQIIYRNLQAHPRLKLSYFSILVVQPQHTAIAPKMTDKPAQS